MSFINERSEPTENVNRGDTRRQQPGAPSLRINHSHRVWGGVWWGRSICVKAGTAGRGGDPSPSLLYRVNQ